VKRGVLVVSVLVSVLLFLAPRAAALADEFPNGILVEVGTTFSGTFSTDIESSNDVYLVLREEDVAAPTFPPAAIVETRQTTAASADQTTHALDMPSGIAAGDLLLAFFNVDSNPTIVWPSGWTALQFGDSVCFAAACRTALAWRAADGSEGSTLSVETTTAQESAALIVRISGAANTSIQLPETTTAATGLDAAPDPPSLTPGDGVTSKNYLFFAIAGHDDVDACTAYPTNFAAGQTTVSSAGGLGGGAGICSAERSLNTTTQNPDAFTLAGAEEWAAFTLAVHPAEAGPEYELLARMFWDDPAFTPGDSNILCIEAYINDGANEDFLVQVLTPPATYNTRLTIAKTSDNDACQNYLLTAAEVNDGETEIRFIGADETATDTQVANLNLDLVRIQTLESSQVNVSDIMSYAWLLGFLAALTLMMMGAWWIKGKRGG